MNNTSRLKVMTVFGTRPDAIKMAPVVLELLKHKEFIETQIVVTGQHRQMLDQVMSVFNISPSADLNIMTHGQTLAQVTQRALDGLDREISQRQPDVVIAQGDTTTTFVAALAAFYHKKKFAHVEAGLRTSNKLDPFPEEMNRRMAAVITDFHFAPTEGAKHNLLNEGFSADAIWVTGNTGIDAMLYILNTPSNETAPIYTPTTDKRMLLVTSHRRENWGEGIENICKAVLKLLERFSDVSVVYSMHPNPTVRETIYKYLSNNDRVQLIEPPDYAPFVKLMSQSHLILTDSGGVQEEAPSLGKPVLVLRKTTERPEGVSAGTAKLIGTNIQKIVETAEELLTNINAYQSMAKAVNPYGDGKAAPKIVQTLCRAYGIELNT